MRLFRVVTLCLPVLLPCGALADDIGPAQAQALQQQLKDWLAGLRGPSVKLPDLPWQISGEHDHYVITWPVSAITSQNGEAAVTANVRPLDGGRWSVDDVKMPPSGSFTINFPNPSDPGNSAPATVDYTIGKQDSHGVIDPSFATPSTLHAEIGDLVVATNSPTQRQEQHFDHYVADTSLTPLGNGRLDLVSNATVDGWKSASQLNGGTPVAVGIQSIRAVGKVGNVSRDRVAALLAATGGLIGALPPDFATQQDKTDIPAPARAQLRQLIDSLQDILTEVSIEETMDGLQVEVSGTGGLSMKRFLLGFGGESPDGQLHAWLHIGLDDLASPSLPPKVAVFLPHHIELRPSLSGVLTSDLHKLALDATAENADNDTLSPDIEAIFSHGGVKLGLEALSFDIGPAKVEGTGQVTAVSPESWHGEAHVTATGFDDLATQARTNPDLQQALPVLVMLRGMAKPDGKRLVWDIVSDGPTVTVNGLDLTQLANGGKPPGKPSQKPSR